MSAAERVLREVLAALGAEDTRPRAARAPAQLASRPMPGFTSPLAESLAEDVLDRFLRYARIDTQSSRDPTGRRARRGSSTSARMLVDELAASGSDAALDDNGYVTATLPATRGDRSSGWSPTSTRAPRRPARASSRSSTAPTTAAPIELPRGGTVLDPAAMPELPQGGPGHRDLERRHAARRRRQGRRGRDHGRGRAPRRAPRAPRPKLRIGFTPDEEIGEGPTLFDIERFGALRVHARRLDPRRAPGRDVHRHQGVVTVHGVDVHPGFATGKLVNAARLAGRVLAALPPDLTPETTSGREGFIHVYEVRATAGKATIRAIVRDFDDDMLERTWSCCADGRGGRGEPSRAPGSSSAPSAVPQHARATSSRSPRSSRAERAIRAEGIEPITRRSAAVRTARC